MNFYRNSGNLGSVISKKYMLSKNIIPHIVINLKLEHLTQLRGESPSPNLV